MQLLFWGGFATLTLGLLYHQANARYWTFALGSYLCLAISFNWLPSRSWIPLGLTYLSLLLLLQPAIRQYWWSYFIFKLYKKTLPSLSQTEQEALHAGTVFWDRELFTGRPNWQQLLTFPNCQLTPAEQDFLDNQVENLCQRLNDWQITHDLKDLPPDIWQYIKQQGFFGLIIPKKYGGLEFSAYAHSNVVMKLASRSMTAAVTVMVPNSLGPAKLLLHYGTQQQKDYYLPRLAKGEEIPCFALTGPNAGSDAGAMTDYGEVCYQEYQGQKTLGILLQWEKRYITLGPVATLLGLAFKLYDPKHLIANNTDLGITLALIPTNTKGITIGQRHNPLNIPFQNGPNSGKDVFIPFDWIIGGKQYIGKGWQMLMECLADGRGISLPASSVGTAKMVCRYSGAYAGIRQQFHLPLAKFEGIATVLAQMAGKTYQLNACRQFLLAALDQGKNPAVLSAIVKYYSTETMRQIINHGMDIEAGHGICLGPNNYLGRTYQGMPIGITVEGANILTRNMIIFGQGAIRAHPYLLEEILAVEQDQLDQFDQSLNSHIYYSISNILRCFCLGLTRAKLSTAPVYSKALPYYQQLNWMSTAFAVSADICLLSLGGQLKRKECLSARLADVLSQLYISSAVLKHFHQQGEASDDLALLNWSCQTSLYAMQQSLIALFANLPNRLLACLLRFIIFPTGYPYHPPKDKLDQPLSKLLSQPSPHRDRLTQGMFYPKHAEEIGYQLEQALIYSHKTIDIEKKIRQAVKRKQLTPLEPIAQIQQAVTAKIISAKEAKALQTAIELRQKVIAVNSFDQQEF